MSIKELIYQAEGLRVAGQFDQVVANMREQTGIDPETISQLGPNELNDHMRSWRLWVSALNSLAKRQWRGNRAMDFIREAESVIHTYYDHDEVKSQALRMTQDAEGNPYHMAAEMFRDRARISLLGGQITGNTKLLDQAINYFNQAMEISDPNSPAHNLVAMEKAIALRRIGHPLDFDQLKLNYHQVIDTSPGNHDRQAIVSWWYTREAILAHNLPEAKVGLRYLRVASQFLEINWLIHYAPRDLVGFVFHHSRRLTYNSSSNSESDSIQ